MENIEKAVYINLTEEEFIGNPLIEALPEDIVPEKYSERLMVFPPYDPKDRFEPPQTRLQYLQRISEIHVATKEDSMILLSLTRVLKWSYAKRNPMPFDVVTEALTERGIKVTDNLIHYLKNLHAPIYGFPILGVSGIGKTTSICNILTLFPQVIQHTEYRGHELNLKQLVWLKVECPADGTPKGLFAAIVKGVDEVLGTDYQSQIIRNRMSKDVMLTKVSRLIKELNLGLLLVDDIQSLISAKESVSSELLSFMVAMTNNLNIPVVMIGTPKFILLLKKEFQQAKRVTGEGEIRLKRLEKDSSEWERFLSVIWHFQYLNHEVPCTKALNNAFYNECVGIPFLVAILYKLVQDDAIISEAETFTVRDVHRVAQSKLGLTSEKRRDMLNGVDVELNQFEIYWKPSVTASKNSDTEQATADLFKATSDIQSQLQTKLAREQPNIKVSTAKKLARQAVAAFSESEDLDMLYNYAVKLLNENKENDKNE